VCSSDLSGEIPNCDGKYIHELMPITPLTDNVGLYAFSHPGIAATNVMALYGDELPNVKYIVGRENPTIDALSCVEIGHWGEHNELVLNPYYRYPRDYTPTGLTIDYSAIGWIQNAMYPDGRPYFAGMYGRKDYILGDRVPRMWGKRYYSMALTQALLTNGALTEADWPSDLATVAETRAAWPFRTTVHNYAALKTKRPDLKIMLVFARNDHVHPALDKPHIHQAYDGFAGEAGLWIRLNPDREYVRAMNEAIADTFPDNDANSEPDWSNPLDWAHPNGGGPATFAAMASLCEMADRVYRNNWEELNLEEVLYNYPEDAGEPEPTELTNEFAIDLPSLSTGSSDGTLALLVKTPTEGNARYPDGAPVLIWVLGGTNAGSLSSDLLRVGEDIIVITFLYPGGSQPKSGRSSDGVYDDRGENCILALRDIILYAAGELTDSNGQTIDDISPVPVLHNNIGLLGSSNGGNLAIAAPAFHGADFADNLRYVIQWESPVNSQFATTNLGGVQVQGASGEQYLRVVNPRYTAYGPLEVTIDYSDLAFDPTNPISPIFHDAANDFDGDGVTEADGIYTTIVDADGYITPDLDGDGNLSLSEDFPMQCFHDGVRKVYSRQATYALRTYNVFDPFPWPATILTPEEADAYWDLREAVRLYDNALAAIPNLEGMILGSVEDHVQTAPDKPHLRQAFEGWNMLGAWVQINPDPEYVVAANPIFSGFTLPIPAPNMPPPDWSNADQYCMPETIADGWYQLAAVWQMADRAHAADSSAVNAWLIH